MGYIRVCDLCGKPLPEPGKEYKIKKRWHSWPDDSGWTTIEAHDECVKILFNSVGKNRIKKDNKAWKCETCVYYPPSSCDGKPCTQCDPDNVYFNCYLKKENTKDNE